VGSILLNGTVAVDPVGPTGIGDHNGNGIPDLMVKFPRGALELVLQEGPAVTVTVTGTVDGHCFVGADVIRVIHAAISAPSAAKALPGGLPTTVRWETPNGVHIQSVALLWSLDDGANWDLVARELPNTGSYDWTVPEVLTTTAKVAVVLVESSDGGYVVDGVLGISETFTIRAVTGVGVSEPAEFALRTVSPSASPRGLEVSFSLPDEQPATLALYDVAGRRLASRDVGGLGVGLHTMRLAEGANLPAGIYMIQLIQGGRSLTTRAAVIH